MSVDISAHPTIPEFPADAQVLTGPDTSTQLSALEVLAALGAPAEDTKTLARTRAMPAASRKTGVTVLIPAHNEAASIGGTLRSLREQGSLPDDVIVVCDNCTDDTAGIAAANGAHVFTTVGNTARKAGALNQALTEILPRLRSDGFVLVMDADSRLNISWLWDAIATLSRNPRAGAVCGVFLGEPGSGIVGQLQRNEYIRYARTVLRRWQAPVLSGTGTLFRVCVLREVARERGRLLPGIHGEFYNSQSITEDDEITLGLKTLGHRCLPVATCETTTEVMPTWRALFRQRVRWQKGALSDLRHYRLTRVTFSYWARQLAIYAGLGLSLACWWVIIASLAQQPGINVAWTVAILGVNFAERVWTVRRVGLWGIFLAVLMVPEFCYDVFRMGVFLRALADELAHREVAWGHVVRKVGT